MISSYTVSKLVRFLYTVYIIYAAYVNVIAQGVWMLSARNLAADIIG